MKKLEAEQENIRMAEARLSAENQGCIITELDDDDNDVADTESKIVDTKIHSQTKEIFEENIIKTNPGNALKKFVTFSSQMY